MKIILPQLPAAITGFSFSVKKLTDSKNAMQFLEEEIIDIFDDDTSETAKQLEIDLYDLVFVNDRPFTDVFNDSIVKKHKKMKNKELVEKAFLLRLMYKGEKVSISSALNDKGHIIINDPEYCVVVGANEEKNGKNKRISKNAVKKEKKQVVLGKRAAGKLEAIRLSALKHGMKQALSYKELIDKYNIRRFSTNLKINNRSTDIEEINKILYERRDLSYTDLSQTSNRINFSVLFAITYGNVKLEDIYGKNVIFEEKDEKLDKSLSDLSNALIGIINKGNGIEIAHTYINMINAFTEIEPPPVDMNDLASVMDNYSMYHACAYLAILCENFFKINNDLKLYMKKHNIYNYWNYVEKVILMKQYSTVVSFCNIMSKFDVEAYTNDSHYQDEILFSFERAFKFSAELKESTSGEKEYSYKDE